MEVISWCDHWSWLIYSPYQYWTSQVRINTSFVRHKKSSFHKLWFSIPMAKPKHSPDPRGVSGDKIWVITQFSGLLNLTFTHRNIPHQVQWWTWSTFCRTLYQLILLFLIYLNFHSFHTSEKSKEKVSGPQFFFSPNLTEAHKNPCSQNQNLFFLFVVYRYKMMLN